MLAALLVSATAHGQAWLPAPGEGAVSLTYQYFNFTGHYTPTGEILHLGGSQSQSLLLAAEYGVTDRLAISAGIPYAIGRNGHDPSPTLGHHGIDDGHYHGALQDYRLGMQVNVIMAPVVFTPFVETQWPSHHYPTEGEAAIGRGLRETRLGFDLARRFDPWLPSMVGNLRVARTFVEKLHGVGTDRSNIDLSLGYFVNDRWSVRVTGQWQETSGGLNFPDDVLDSPVLFRSHDRILDDDHIRAVAGVSFAINDRTDLDASYIRSVSGSNTHLGSGLVLTVSRAFGRK
jgi:hypothetical protein